MASRSWYGSKDAIQPDAIVLGKHPFSQAKSLRAPTDALMHVLMADAFPRHARKRDVGPGARQQGSPLASENPSDPPRGGAGDRGGPDRSAPGRGGAG